MRWLLLLLCCYLAPLTAQNHEGPQADIDQILVNAKAFSGYLMAGDLEAIVGSYTEDGKIFPNNLPLMEGSKALASYWKPQPGYRTTHHKLTPLEIKVVGDEARDHGYYEGRSVGPDGNERSWGGKYLVIWRKTADGWKMYLDIWNSNPAPE